MIPAQIAFNLGLSIIIGTVLSIAETVAGRDAAVALATGIILVAGSLLLKRPGPS